MWSLFMKWISKAACQHPNAETLHQDACMHVEHCHTCGQRVINGGAWLL